MIRLLFRLIRLVILCLVLGVGLYYGGPYLLTALGHYLVTQDPDGKADLIVVLAGGPYLRVPEAARLYQEGRAPAILVTNEMAWPGFEEVRRAGMSFPDAQEISLQILEAMRVPRSAVRTLTERADSTRAEMEAVARFLKEHPARRLLIVTSRAHTTRAGKIFTAGLGPKVRVLMHPVRSDPWNPAGWWRSREQSKQLLHEYQGLADYWRLRAWDWTLGMLWGAPAFWTTRNA
jgi:uncharacterized SAM-binding protein YcdF (DUF218 family)